ncbi:MAG: AI-2E family transporter, partial [Marinobacter sp.]
MDAQVLSSLKTAAVVGGVGLLLLGIWFFSDFFLLLFAGILWGVGLTGVARFGAHHGRMPYSVSLTVSLLVLSGAVALAGWYIGPKVVDGLQELRKMIPETFEEFRSEIRHFGLLHQLSDRLSAAGASLMDAETFGRIAGMLSTTLGVVTAGFFILLTGIYFAVRPGVYQRGIERLVVPRHRAYAREILHELAHSLRWWLLGRMLALIVVGVLTWTGLF